MTAPEGVIRADSRSRFNFARFIEDAAGRFFRVVANGDGTWTVSEVVGK